MKYIKSLDSLRAIAVFAVIFDHWALVYEHGNNVPSFLHTIPFGTIGVTAFFVLSGFLITGILLDSKLMIESKKLSLKKAFKIFYIRRTLRIFPIYYILLIALLIFAPYLFEFDSKSSLWLFSYMTNFFLYFKADWIGRFLPLWSLAVEEQFYLFWPFLILLVRPKYLLTSIISLIFIGVFSRIYFEYLSSPSVYRGGFYIFTTPTCFDSFGLGALLAYFIKNNMMTDKIKAILKYSSIVSFVILILIISLLKFPTPTQNIGYRFLISVITLQIIISLMNTNKFSKLFENPITVYLGKISYSLYLFHNFLPNIYQKLNSYFINKDLKIPYTNYSWFPYVGGGKQFFIYLVFLIILSTISWFLIEKPINKLKNKFEY
jgi:peptidoglycan/LPS O-acetylase OafA/YrhL